jgi:hypothetical protein
MTEAIHFNCQHCGLPYLAERQAMIAQYSGTIDCVDCKKVAHEWTGFYDIRDWRPVRMQAVRPGTKI